MYGSLSTSRRPTYNPLPASKLLLLSDGPGETAAPLPPDLLVDPARGKRSERITEVRNALLSTVLAKL